MAVWLCRAGRSGRPDLFGWVGVIGTYFLHTQRLDWQIFLPATSSGLLAVAVLNVNNIRDLRSDALAGKHSIPVRIGPHKARVYHWLLLTGAVLAALLYVLLDFSTWWQFLFLLAVRRCCCATACWSGGRHRRWS